MDEREQDGINKANWRAPETGTWRTGTGPNALEFDQINERQERPQKLYRGVSIDPEELSVERLRQDLVPGSVNKDDPTKIGDGNELGVYTSTNESMVDAAYAKGGDGVTAAPMPRFHDGYSVSDSIRLPACGVIYEIGTNGLDIRRPYIRPELQGVYNNGFEGDEWIADQIPAKFTKVKKMILSRFANDPKQFKVEVADESDEGLQAAIDQIKAEYEQRKQAAEVFRQKLEELPEAQRMNSYKTRKLLEEIDYY